ncbi:hypothetical protein GYMLUDRAFT_242808 [Collybiopsis luxurians FD-317 M1]|uniref:Uncharacterized protein n=1 Tax=Collybiopsis luxurians FD-317 M1 TaxID=944289 RepID=A0A0D0CHI7_9AGAR|nr:hypothetical protein GYMLUDRAFT_242808 [Collybiopsis luxurians FD-317 M1]
MAHIQLRSSQKSLGWAPSGRYWDQYSGSIQQWFNAVTQMNQAMSVESQSGCWRQEREDDKITSICAGESQQIEFITDIPVLLNLAPDITTGKFWDFPIELFIGPKASAHKKGLVYDLVGMVLTNGNHYIALTVIPTSSNNKAVFAYDGMKNQGHSKYKSGKVTELLTGQPPACAPPGFTTNTVLYKLRGGTAARNLFQSLQVANAKMHLNVLLENPLLPSLSLPDWIKTSHSPFDEYSLSQPNIPSRVMKEAQISVDFIDLAGEDFQLDDLTGEHAHHSVSSHHTLSPQPDSMDVEDMIAKTLETHSSHSPTPELQFPPSPLILSSSPPPSSPHPVICRCGVQAVGYREAPKKDPKQFYCHMCRDSSDEEQFNHVLSKLSGLRKQPLSTVAQRLFPGKGVLIKLGPLYYYPAHLINFNKETSIWKVEMWRGIHNEYAGKIQDAPVSTIVDGLWQDTSGRQKIQLGHYMRPLVEKFRKEHESDEMLLDWTAVKCTTEIQRALEPHKLLLKDLAVTPKSDAQFSLKFSEQAIPALSYCPPKNFPTLNPTFYCGGLWDTDLAGIRNWLYQCIGPDDAVKLEIHHLLDYSIAHACTLLLAYCYFSEFALDVNEDDVNWHVLHKAWERLQDWNGLTPDGKMEQTKPADAGLAGNHQWGLDAGPHEGGGDPQLVGPSVTPDELKQKGNDEEEIVHGPNFKHGMESYNDLREDLDQEHGKKELRGAKKRALSNAAKGKGAAKRQRKM